MELPASCTLIDLIGKPFVNGGRGPRDYDCWGLAVEVFRRYGIVLPDYKISALNGEAILRQYQEVKSDYIEVSGVLPVPCLAFMRLSSPGGNHCGVFIGSGKFIHARSKTGVCIERLDHPAYRCCIIGYYVPR